MTLPFFDLKIPDKSIPFLAFSLFLLFQLPRGVSFFDIGMITVWPIGVHFQGHMLAGRNMNSRWKRHRCLPPAAGIIKIQTSPHI